MSRAARGTYFARVRSAPPILTSASVAAAGFRRVLPQDAFVSLRTVLLFQVGQWCLCPRQYCREG